MQFLPSLPEFVVGKVSRSFTLRGGQDSPEEGQMDNLSACGWARGLPLPFLASVVFGMEL